MLMDEPFGAIDPITRERLQDEFLKIQDRLRKTIVFVTHDINEAIKMGNSIALMKDGKLVQHDAVDALLANPKNKFVEDFVGADRALKRLMLVRVEQAMQKDPPRVSTEDSISKVRERMAREKIDNLLVTDRSGVLKGYVRLKVLQGKTGRIEQAVHPVSATVEEGTNLKDALAQMLISDVGYLSVVDERGKLKGLLTTSTLQKVVGETYTAKGGPSPRYLKEKRHS
jgi:osmoprotectant transport system ATP-binding protein